MAGFVSNTHDVYVCIAYVYGWYKGNYTLTTQFTQLHDALTLPTEVLYYRDLQVGWGTPGELKITHAYIIDHNTIQHCSLEIQLCTSCGYQLKL